MSYKTKPLDGPFGIEVEGVDVKAPLSAEQVALIDALMDEHAAVLIRGETMDQDEQLAFSKQFGPQDAGFKKVAAPNPRMKHMELGDISNLAPDGSVAGRSEKRIVNNLANRMWHSDSSFQRPAAKYSMLHCIRPTSWGGQTELADMRAAYDALDPMLKAQVAGLEAEHFALHSRFMLGDEGYSEAQRSAIAPVTWPVVRTHPGSGRKHLFIGAHARAIKGMTVPEGRMLLWDLLEHATQPAFRYSHEWAPGDLLIWDNRCTLHRGRPFDLGEPRELRRSTTLDDKAPELALAS